VNIRLAIVDDVPRLVGPDDGQHEENSPELRVLLQSVKRPRLPKQQIAHFWMKVTIKLTCIKAKGLENGLLVGRVG